MVDTQIDLDRPRGHLPLGASGHVHLDHPPENVRSMENRRQPADEADSLRRGQRNDREVRSGVPSQRQRNAIHHDGDLPVFPSPQSGLSLPSGIAPDLDEGHFPKDLFQSRRRRHHHGVQGDLHRASPARGRNGPGNQDRQALELEKRHARSVGPYGVRDLSAQGGRDEKTEEKRGGATGTWQERIHGLLWVTIRKEEGPTEALPLLDRSDRLEDTEYGIDTLEPSVVVPN